MPYILYCTYQGIYKCEYYCVVVEIVCFCGSVRRSVPSHDLVACPLNLRLRQKQMAKGLLGIRIPFFWRLETCGYLGIFLMST